MEKIFEALCQIGVVPVIAIDRADDAVPLARALLAGGIGCAEITFRTAVAAEAIRRLTGEVREMLAGAGTVLTVQQAEQAALAGARYIVSPGFDAAVVDWCQEHHVPVLPRRGHSNRDQHGACKRGEDFQILSCRRIRWCTHAQGAVRALSRGALHSHWRDPCTQSCRVPGVAKRRRVRRQLDGDEQDDS